MKLSLLISACFYLSLTACGENKGRIGGAFAGTGRTTGVSSPSSGVYIKIETITTVENLRARSRGSIDPNCNQFREELNPQLYTLKGLTFDDSLFFREVEGLLNTVLNSQKSVARMSPNFDFEFTDLEYQQSENPFNESLIATFTDDRLVTSLKRLRNNGGAPEQQFGSTVYQKVSLSDFRLMNDDLTRACR